MNRESGIGNRESGCKHMRYAHATRTAVSGQRSVVSGQLILFKSTICVAQALAFGHAVRTRL
ncbi:MAG: hypothetical protein F6K26_24385 [Moorea sp. SIO2I5]|nr:hypothetical protein [Moorena sp. SIO2I5]